MKSFLMTLGLIVKHMNQIHLQCKDSMLCIQNFKNPSLGEKQTEVLLNVTICDSLYYVMQLINFDEVLQIGVSRCFDNFLSLFSVLKKGSYRISSNKHWVSN